MMKLNEISTRNNFMFAPTIFVHITKKYKNHFFSKFLICIQLYIFLKIYQKNEKTRRGIPLIWCLDIVMREEVIPILMRRIGII
jgi:hypothetical protein